MSSKNHLVFSKDHMRIRMNHHKIIVHKLINQNSVRCYTCRFQSTMTDLSSSQGNKCGFPIKGCFGVPHGELHDFWRWKTFRKLLPRISLPFDSPVIACMHQISLLKFIALGYLNDLQLCPRAFCRIVLVREQQCAAVKMIMRLYIFTTVLTCGRMLTSKPTNVFIPGKNWRLSLAEIAAFFEARNIKFEVD